MFDNHLKIINTGTPHFDITPKKLGQPHRSRPRNPIVANLFCRAGIIEPWGMATLKVIDWCRDNAARLAGAFLSVLAADLAPTSGTWSASTLRASQDQPKNSFRTSDEAVRLLSRFRRRGARIGTVPNLFFNRS
jgi:hypothetical protein